MKARTKKTLIVDGQVFQTPAMFRGMGKYTNELMQALTALNREQRLWGSIKLVLSSNIATDYDPVVELYEWKNEVDIDYIPVKPNVPGSMKLMRTNRKIVDEYIASLGYEQYDFFIPALFQSEICPVFPSTDGVRKIMLMHDLIPLAFAGTYLSSEDIRREYLTNLTECFRSDVFVTNSKTVANDLCQLIGVDAKRVVPILGGPINHAQKENEVKVSKPFILMPTGNDVRKNNKRGILGFEKFNKQHNDAYELVITSHFLEHEIKELLRLSSRVRFLGNVSGAELNYLYAECETLLFPAEYEGLGLPILEAVQKMKPVACSDISVFKEMSDNAFEYFDFTDTNSIAEALDRAVQGQPNKDRYEEILETFSWDSTALRMIDGLMNRGHVITPSERDYLVYCGDPLQGKGGAIAQFIAAEFTKQTRSTVFCSDYQPHNNLIDNNVNFLPYLEPFLFESSRPLWLPEDGFRERIYVLDNSTTSAPVLARALSNPGTVVLTELPVRTLWEELRDAGYISDLRFRLEVRLGEAGGSEYECLLSLLTYHKNIVVIDKDHKAILDGAKHKLQRLGVKSVAAIHLLKEPEVIYSNPELVVDRKSFGFPVSDFVRSLIDITEK